MLNFFIKIKTVNSCYKNLKVSQKTIIYIYLYILKKNSITFLFKSSFLNKKKTLIQSPFHYKNSKKGVYLNTVTHFICMEVYFSSKETCFFFLKRSVLLNPGFFNIQKIKIKGILSSC
jgi:hypothetical protein